MDANVVANVYFNFALGVQTVAKLLENGVLSKDDAKDIYDQVLLNLEQHQALFPEYQDAFDLARQTAERALLRYSS